MNTSISTEALLEEYLKIAKENGAEYIAMISENLENSNDNDENLGAVIYPIDDRVNFNLISLGGVSKSAKKAVSYVDGGTINNISDPLNMEVILGCQKA